MNFVYNFVYGPAKVSLRVREFLAALKTHWRSLVVVCSLVGLFSLWHIPHFNSQFYIVLVRPFCRAFDFSGKSDPIFHRRRRRLQIFTLWLKFWKQTCSECWIYNYIKTEKRLVKRDKLSWIWRKCHLKKYNGLIWKQ